MDPWLSEYRALSPVLDDPHIRELHLVGALMFAKAASLDDKQASLADTADTEMVKDFSGHQGHLGWSYSFRSVDDFSQHVSKAVFYKGRWYSADTSTPWPYIAANSMHPHMSSVGEGVAAVRSYRFRDGGQAVVSGDFSAEHECGDGTEVQILLELPEQPPRLLASWMTLEMPSKSLQLPVEVVENAYLHISVAPLASDACDAVSTSLSVMHAEGSESIDGSADLEQLRRVHTSLLADSSKSLRQDTPPRRGAWKHLFYEVSSRKEITPSRFDDASATARIGIEPYSIPYIAAEEQHSSVDIEVIRRFTLLDAGFYAISIMAEVPLANCTICGDGLILSFSIDSQEIWVQHLTMAQPFAIQDRFNFNKSVVLQWTQSSGRNDWHDRLRLHITIKDAAIQSSS